MPGGITLPPPAAASTLRSTRSPVAAARGITATARVYAISSTSVPLTSSSTSTTGSGAVPAAARRPSATPDVSLSTATTTTSACARWSAARSVISGRSPRKTRRPAMLSWSPAWTTTRTRCSIVSPEFLQFSSSSLLRGSSRILQPRSRTPSRTAEELDLAERDVLAGHQTGRVPDHEPDADDVADAGVTALRTGLVGQRDRHGLGRAVRGRDDHVQLGRPGLRVERLLLRRGAAVHHDRQQAERAREGEVDRVPDRGRAPVPVGQSVDGVGRRVIGHRRARRRARRPHGHRGGQLVTHVLPQRPGLRPEQHARDDEHDRDQQPRQAPQPAGPVTTPPPAPPLRGGPLLGVVLQRGGATAAEPPSRRVVRTAHRTGRAVDRVRDGRGRQRAPGLRPAGQDGPQLRRIGLDRFGWRVRLDARQHRRGRAGVRLRAPAEVVAAVAAELVRVADLRTALRAGTHGSTTSTTQVRCTGHTDATTASTRRRSTGPYTRTTGFPSPRGSSVSGEEDQRTSGPSTTSARTPRESDSRSTSPPAVPRLRCRAMARATTARRNGSGHAGSSSAATQDDSQERKSSGASAGSRYAGRLSIVDSKADSTASSPAVNRRAKSSSAYIAGSISPSGCLLGRSGSAALMTCRPRPGAGGRTPARWPRPRVVRSARHARR